jgi:hypothetical protein
MCSVYQRVSCRTGRLRGERPLRGVCTLLWLCQRLRALALFGDRFLRQLGGELFDLDEERLVVVNADAMYEEDDSASASDGDEHPYVNG